LGLPYRSVEVQYRAGAGPLGLLGAVTCAGITRASRQQLVPPWPGTWPRLLLSAGLRNEPLARWVQRASGGYTRLVFVGRTWCSHDALDLLVTTPQYRIAAGPRVQRNRLTQHRIGPERLAREATTAHPLLTGMTDPETDTGPAGGSGPLLGVLVGGSSGPYVLGRRNAARLARALRGLAQRTGGRLVVTTSARTALLFVTALAEALPADARLYRFRPDDPDNPYLAILARSDALVVTGDSVAMLSEATATGRPVYIWDVPVDSGADHSVAARAYRAMMRGLPARLTRDVGIVHRELVAAGLAARLDADGGVSGAVPAPSDLNADIEGEIEAEIEATLQRLRALL
ncbi:MAG: ELM1/GtrOC1 family putative glycosyltransferase, partial [Gammaproteobacteria bacterium]